MIREYEFMIVRRGNDWNGRGNVQPFHSAVLAEGVHYVNGVGVPSCPRHQSKRNCLYMLTRTISKSQTRDRLTIEMSYSVNGSRETQGREVVRATCQAPIAANSESM
jgi:hypothetical protein